MIRVLIVDDEPLVRERVRTLLSSQADIEIVGEAGDGPSALDAYVKAEPQVVFLDIQMPGLSGLEVAEVWRREGSLPVIIFVTAFDQFAVQAFRLHALDYILKPIDPDRLAEAMGRAREILRLPARDGFEHRLQALVDCLDIRRTAWPRQLAVRDKDRYLLVPVSEIECLEATGNYVCLHVERGSHLLRGTLERPQHIVISPDGIS